MSLILTAFKLEVPCGIVHVQKDQNTSPTTDKVAQSIWSLIFVMTTLNVLDLWTFFCIAHILERNVLVYCIVVLYNIVIFRKVLKFLFKVMFT